MLDFSRCRLVPFRHQREDVEWLMARPYAFLASEMRTGKTKIVVDAAQFMFEDSVIDRVIVVCPAPVRNVWADEVLGEIAKHSFIQSSVTEFHAKVRTWRYTDPDPKKQVRKLEWIVTNFEFIRSKNRLAQLLAACNSRTMLVLDESSFVKNHAAQQTKACLQLRRACGRVVLLNGTPIFHSPIDLFSQGNLLHKDILECYDKRTGRGPYITYFRARYALMTPVLRSGGKPMIDPYGKPIQTVTGWTNLDDLQRRFAPVTVRRLQKDCLDLPPKLDPVTLTATLTDETWKVYKQMRDELVVWLKSGDVVTSATAAVKVLRLSQITGGFLGGVEDANINGSSNTDVMNSLQDASMLETRVYNPTSSIEIGREKLDVLLWFIEQRLEADPNLHLVAWCRFRAEMFRAAEEVAKRFPQFEVALIMGGQKNAERLRALSLLMPETSPAGPVFVVGIEGTGSFGLDMTASHTCVTLSSGYSLGKSAQTLDRVYGPGQKFPISYFSILAVGPKNQRTIDHQIEVARRAGEDVANWTAGAWIKALTEE
jgi:hypothetical protein